MVTSLFILIASLLAAGSEPSILLVRLPGSDRLDSLADHLGRRLAQGQVRCVEPKASTTEFGDGTSLCLVVVESLLQDSVVRERSDDVRRWVERGGKIVLFELEPEPRQPHWLELPPLVQRPSWEPGVQIFGPLEFTSDPHPLLGTLSGATLAHLPLHPFVRAESPSWTPLARDPGGVALAVRTFGEGTVAVFQLPPVLTGRHEMMILIAENLARWAGYEAMAGEGVGGSRAGSEGVGSERVSPGTERPEGSPFPALIEVEELAGAWALQRDLIGFSGQGYFSDLPHQELSPLEAPLAAALTARAGYPDSASPIGVWVRAYQGHKVARQVVLEADSTRYPATHTGSQGEEFAWWFAGNLPPAASALRVLDDPGSIEILDALLLAPASFNPVTWADSLDAMPVRGSEDARFLDEVLARLAPSPLTCRSVAEWEERAPRLRLALRRALGWDRPYGSCPLDARVLGETDRGDHRLLRITYQSLPGFVVPANLYLPAGPPPPWPAVVIPVGHWSRGKADPALQAQAVDFARTGIAALVPESLGHGERANALNGHDLAFSLLLSGRAARGIMIYELTRALDYLESRPDIDGRHLGACGSSAGGLDSWILAAVEERVKATAPVAFVTGYRDFFERRARQCPCVYLPGLARAMDQSAVIALTAPRPFLLVCATHDPLFPVEGSRRMVEEARPVYELLGESEKLEIFESNAGHAHNREMRERITGFMRYHLLGEGEGVPVPEEEVPILNRDDPAMRVLADEASEKCGTFTDVARQGAQAARTERKERGVVSDSELRRDVRDLLTLEDEPARGASLVTVRTLDTLGFHVVVQYLRTGKAPLLPLLRLPRPEPLATVLVVTSTPKELYLLSDEARSLAETDFQLLLVDLVGSGELRHPDFLAARGGILVEAPFLGRKLEGLLALIRRTQGEGLRPLVLWGADVEGSLLAELAACLLPGIEALVLRSPLKSFEDLIMARHMPETLYLPRVLQVFDRPDLGPLRKGVPTLEGQEAAASIAWLTQRFAQENR
ncbi:MAG: dienelactone hydrolase family protein [Planctomycetota bacterium]